MYLPDLPAQFRHHCTYVVRTLLPLVRSRSTWRRFRLNIFCFGLQVDKLINIFLISTYLADGIINQTV